MTLSGAAPELIATAVGGFLVGLYTGVVRPRLARRMLIARVQVISNCLHCDIEHGVLPRAHPLVTAVALACGRVMRDPHSALADVRCDLRGWWAEHLLAAQPDAIDPDLDRALTPKGISLLSDVWRELGEALAAYAVDGSPWWFLRSRVPSPPLGATLVELRQRGLPEPTNPGDAEPAWSPDTGQFPEIPPQPPAPAQDQGGRLLQPVGAGGSGRLYSPQGGYAHACMPHTPWAAHPGRHVSSLPHGR